MDGILKPDGEDELDAVAEKGEADAKDIEAVKKLAGLQEALGEDEDFFAKPNMEEIMSKMNELGLSGSGGEESVAAEAAAFSKRKAVQEAAARQRIGEPDDVEYAGGGGRWYFQQRKNGIGDDGTEMYVRIPQDPPISKKDVSVTFKRSSLNIVIKGETIIDGKLNGMIDVDECTWCILSGGTEVEVMLTKEKVERWRTLLDST